MTGTVKWFNYTKHFGYIEADDKGPDVFVHEDMLTEETVLYDQMEVSFEVQPNYLHPKTKTRRALNGVRALSKRAYVNTAVLPSNPKKVVERQLVYGTD